MLLIKPGILDVVFCHINLWTSPRPWRLLSAQISWNCPDGKVSLFLLKYICFLQQTCQLVMEKVEVPDADLACVFVLRLKTNIVPVNERHLQICQIYFVCTDWKKKKGYEVGLQPVVYDTTNSLACPDQYRPAVCYAKRIIVKSEFYCVLKYLLSLDDLWTAGGLQDAGAHSQHVCVLSLRWTSPPSVTFGL